MDHKSVFYKHGRAHSALPVSSRTLDNGHLLMKAGPKMFRHTVYKVVLQFSAQGMLLCCRAFSLASFGPREQPNIQEKDGEAKKRKVGV